MSRAEDIVLVAGGDFCPVGRPESGFRDGSLTPEAIIGSLRGLFADSDISVVNLESPLTERGAPIAKTGPGLRSSPEMIRLLSCLGVTVAALANNHIRDFGDPGVEDTLALCSANGIRTVGAGATLDAARQTLFVSSKGRVVAFVNAAEQEFGNATPKRAGANPLDIIDLLRDLRHARSRADHVVLIVHGGLEFTHCPSPESVKQLRFFAEQKVTAIIRHHAHYVQGYEIWKGVPIFYGLGNMLFDTSSPGRSDWCWGLLVRLNISPDDRCSVELYPISQCEDEPIMRVLEAEPREKRLQDIADYSSLLADMNELLQAWEATLQPLREDYYGKLLVPSSFLRRVIRRLGLLKFFSPGKKSLLLWENLLRCATHREALSDIVSKEQGK